MIFYGAHTWSTQLDINWGCFHPTSNVSGRAVDNELAASIVGLLLSSLDTSCSRKCMKRNPPGHLWHLN